MPACIRAREGLRPWRWGFMLNPSLRGVAQDGFGDGRRDGRLFLFVSFTLGALDSNLSSMDRETIAPIEQIRLGCLLGRVLSERLHGPPECRFNLRVGDPRPNHPKSFSNFAGRRVWFLAEDHHNDMSESVRRAVADKAAQVIL
jgi:hypothetical protein